MKPILPFILLIFLIMSCTVKKAEEEPNNQQLIVSSSEQNAEGELSKQQRKIIDQVIKDDDSSTFLVIENFDKNYKGTDYSEFEPYDLYMDKEIIKSIIKYDAKYIFNELVWRTPPETTTYLGKAIKNGDLELMDIYHDMLLNFFPETEANAFLFNEIKFYEEKMDYFLSKDIDLGMTYGFRTSRLKPLTFLMLEHGDLDKLRELMDRGLDINALDETGYSIASLISDVDYDIDTFIKLKEMGLIINSETVNLKKLLKNYNPTLDDDLERFNFYRDLNLDVATALEHSIRSRDILSGTSRFYSKHIEFLDFILKNIPFYDEYEFRLFYRKVIHALIYLDQLYKIEKIQNFDRLPDEYTYYPETVEQYRILVDYGLTDDKLGIGSRMKVELLQELVRNGLDPFEDNGYDSVFTKCLRVKNRELSLYLLDVVKDINGDVNSWQEKGYVIGGSYLLIALDYAYYERKENFKDVVYAILDRKPDISTKDPLTGVNAILQAVNYDWDIDIITELLNRGADVNISAYYYESGDEVTPLQIAVDKGNLEIIKLLLSYGADKSKVEYTGENVTIQNLLKELNPSQKNQLTNVIKTNDRETFKLMEDYHNESKDKKYIDFEPFDLYMNKEVIREILEYGADNIAEYLLFQSSIHLQNAIKNGDLELMDLYYDMLRKFFPERADSHMIQNLQGDQRKIENFLSKDIDVNLLYGVDGTPLSFFLLQKTDIDRLAEFQAKGMDINAVDKNGYSIATHINEYDLEIYYKLMEMGLEINSDRVNLERLFDRYNASSDKDLERLKFYKELNLDLDTAIEHKINNKTNLSNGTIGFNLKQNVEFDQESLGYLDFIFEKVPYNDEDTSKYFYLKLIEKLISLNQLNIINNIKNFTRLPDDKVWNIKTLDQYQLLETYGLTYEHVGINSETEPDLLKHLIDSGLDPFKDNGKDSVFTLCLRYKYRELALYLLDLEDDINRHVNSWQEKGIVVGGSYLIIALNNINGRKLPFDKVINSILVRNPDVNIVDPLTGVNAILQAVNYDWNMSIIEELLLRGADVNVTGYYNESGDKVSALEIATERKNYELMELLIRHGADKTRINYTGDDKQIKAILGIQI